jgi:hypothetical protein
MMSGLLHEIVNTQIVRSFVSPQLPDVKSDPRDAWWVRRRGGVRLIVGKCEVRAWKQCL